MGGEFSDADRAVCHSYMYAQHVLEGSPGGEFYLLRGSYTSHMTRTPEGWRIERLIQHVGWEEGNTGAVAATSPIQQEQAAQSREAALGRAR